MTLPDELARMAAHAQGLLLTIQTAEKAAAGGALDTIGRRTLETDARRHLLEIYRLIDRLPDR